MLLLPSKLRPTPQRHRATQPRTCLEDLVADRESRPVRLVVGDELDEELPAAGDDGRRRNLPAELSHHGRQLVPTVVDLHIVVPVEGERGLDL